MTGSVARVQAMPAGLKLARDVISAKDEAKLIAACAKCDLAYYEQDPENPRSRAQFGWHYDIRADTFTRCAPIPPAFEDICAIAAGFVGVAPGEIIECFVIRYEPGSMIQPHYDKPVFEQIVGLSLGADTDMVFSKPANLGGEAIEVRLPA